MELTKRLGKEHLKLFTRIQNSLKKYRQFRNISLRSKLITMAIVVSLIPIAIISLYNMSNSVQLIEEAVLSKNKLYIEMAHERMNNYFNSREIDAETLSTSKNLSDGLEVLNGFNADVGQTRKIENDFRQIMKTPVEAYGFTDIFVTNKYNEIVYSLNYDKLDLSPLVFSNTFVETAMSGEQNWSPLFRNSFIDDNILVLSTPIYAYASANKTTPIGTINMVLNQGALNRLVQEGIETVSENGETYLISAEGVLLTNTIQSFVDEKTVLEDSIETKGSLLLKEAILKGEPSYYRALRYKDLTGKQVIGALTITQLGDSYAGLITEVPVKEAFAVVEGFKVMTGIIAMIMLLISMLFAVVISRSISLPIERIIGVVNKLSNYELTINKKIFGSALRKDEIGQLERAVVQISDNLILLLKEVEISANQVVHASSDLHEQAVDSLARTNQAKASVYEIKEASQVQALGTEKTLKRTARLNEILESNQRELKSVVAFMDEVETLTDMGLKIVNKLNEVSLETMETNKLLNESINHSHHSFKEIESAAELIVGIAKKTNLLSLNASIEASRAGEHGLGFVVVSEEIRKLANQSEAYSNRINESISRMIRDNTVVSTRLNDLLNVSENQMASVQETRQKYVEINKAMRETQSLIHKLDQHQLAIEEMRILVEEEVLSLSKMSTENVEASSVTVQTIETQSKIAHALTASSRALDDLSTKLKSEVSKFKYEQN